MLIWEYVKPEILHILSLQPDAKKLESRAVPELCCHRLKSGNRRYDVSQSVRNNNGHKT